jgi:hypothetical protein
MCIRSATSGDNGDHAGTSSTGEEDVSSATPATGKTRRRPPRKCRCDITLMILYFSFHVCIGPAFLLSLLCSRYVFGVNCWLDGLSVAMHEHAAALCECIAGTPAAASLECSGREGVHMPSMWHFHVVHGLRVRFVSVASFLQNFPLPRTSIPTGWTSRDDMNASTSPAKRSKGFYFLGKSRIFGSASESDGYEAD